MRRSVLPALVVVLSVAVAVAVAVAGYSLLVLGNVLFAVTAVGALVSTFLLYERGDREKALVNAILWSVLAAGLVSGRFAVFAGAVVFVVLALLYWLFLRSGRGSGPSPGTS